MKPPVYPGALDPHLVPGQGQQRGSFVDFLHDAYLDTRNPKLMLNYPDAEALASYISSHYVLSPRKDLR